MEEESVKIEDIIEALKERWQLIVCITLTITIVVTFASYFVIKPRYRASSKLFIGKQTTNSKTEYNSNDVLMYQKLLKTYADVITTRDLIESALDTYGIDADVGTILGGIEVTPQTDTQIMSIGFTSIDKELSRDVVEAVTNEFVKRSSELITNSDVKIIEKVVLPTAPVSPNKKVNILVAMVIGLLLGSIIAIVLKFSDNTFRDKEKLEKVINLPVLGTIPNSEIVK